MKIRALRTGWMGSGLTSLWANAGEGVFLGLRDGAESRSVSTEIAKANPGSRLHRRGNAGVVRVAEVVMMDVRRCCREDGRTRSPERRPPRTKRDAKRHSD